MSGDLRLTPEVAALLNLLMPIDVDRLPAITTALQAVVDSEVARSAPDPCACEPGSNVNGWHEVRCAECVAVERAAWARVMTPTLTCGGCQGLGAHVRWCREAVGYMASVLGPLAERMQDAGDLIGPNDMGLTNRLYGAAGELAKYAKTRSTPTPSATDESEK